MTYSIVGRDEETGELGVAIQSQAFNAGAAVPWAWPGIGAIATQSLTDRRYGWRGLELLAAGSAPKDALAELRGVDEVADFRQVGIVSAGGQTAQWTGAHCIGDAGGVDGDGWSAQANMAASPLVWEAMGEAFASSAGSLAERLMTALEAAESEGGDWRGRGGAALLVVPAVGDRWERIIDLRVEEGDDSLIELRRLLDRALGYREANRATRGRAEVGTTRGLPAIYVLQLSLEDAVDEGRFADADVILSQLEQEYPRWRDAVRTMSLHPEGEAFGRFLAETDPTGT